METRKGKKMDSTSEVGVASVVGVASENVLRTDLESIVAKAVEAAVKVVREEFNRIVHDLNEHISQLEERIICVEGTVNQEASETFAESPQITELNNKIDAITRENRKLSVWANEVDQYGRRNHIRILGLKVKKDDDCRQVVSDFVRDSLKVPITNDDIEAAHIIPVRNSGQPSSSSAMSQHSSSKKPTGSTVIVRFQRREARDKVIRQRRLLKDSGITVVEDLSHLNLEVINRLKRSPQVKQTWSWNGHIFASLKNGQIIKVKPFQSIDECEVIG